MISSQLLAQIPHTFKDQRLLTKALTHPSTTRSQKVSDFERLEFLGDRVLGVLIAHMVYERYPFEKEGDLSRRFVALVCREACLEIAHQIQLRDHLKASLDPISSQSVILADAIEAIIGALYLDGGLKAASKFINAYWPALLEKDIYPPTDAKTALQELAQAKNLGASPPMYEVLERSGPAHTPVFTVCVTVEGLGTATGIGPSKRQAEQIAAKKLLAEVGQSYESRTVEK